MKKRSAKKLELNRETVANLSRVVGGRAEVESGGPVICYYSDCNPCETTVYAPVLPGLQVAPIKDGDVAPAPADGNIRVNG